MIEADIRSLSPRLLRGEPPRWKLNGKRIDPPYAILLQTRPDLTLKECAQQVNRSYSWAKKWAKRLAAAPPDDLTVLCSRSRAHTTPYHTWDALVKRRIEQIRLVPPEGLQRTPGPKAIAYSLPRDAELAKRGCPLP